MGKHNEDAYSIQGVAYTPVLQGASDNPTVTYANTVGRYCLIGKMCLFTLSFQTTTMTKTTLTDQVRITLPFGANALSNNIQPVMLRVENATAVVNGNYGEIQPGNSYISVFNLPLAAARASLTYAVASLGVLTNTINYQASGWYEIA